MSIETVGNVEPVETVGPVVSVETVGPVEPVGPDKMSKKVNVPRTGGGNRPGRFAGLDQKYSDHVICTWDDDGTSMRKLVKITEFVELNPEYAYLLPQPQPQPQQIIIEFSRAQIKAFQQCENCPQCLKEI
jgi:hypothetical protein